LIINLTPFIPLSSKGEGEEYHKRGFASLQLSFSTYYFEGEGKEILERGEAPLLSTPPSLNKGRGSGG